MEPGLQQPPGSWPCATALVPLQVPLVRAPSTPFPLPVQIGNIYQQFSSPEVGEVRNIIKLSVPLLLQPGGPSASYACRPPCIRPVVQPMQLVLLDTHAGARAQVRGAQGRGVKAGTTTAAKWQSRLQSPRCASSQAQDPSHSPGQDRALPCVALPCLALPWWRRLGWCRQKMMALLVGRSREMPWGTCCCVALGLQVMIKPSSGWLGHFSQDTMRCSLYCLDCR